MVPANGACRPLLPNGLTLNIVGPNVLVSSHVMMSLQLSYIMDPVDKIYGCLIFE